jgi:hypothetical protein
MKKYQKGFVCILLCFTILFADGKRTSRRSNDGRCCDDVYRLLASILSHVHHSSILRL